MATSADRMRAAEALQEVARLLESGTDRSTFTRWIERDRGAGYYVRVVLPDDVFRAGVYMVKGRTEQ